MTEWKPSAEKSFSSGKFYPPHLEGNKYLLRGRLLNELAQNWGKSKRILFIQAQAGQGKSILASQFLAHIRARFAWYQVGPEDGDTVLLLNSLLTCFKEALPGFDSPLLSDILAKGEAFSPEAPRLGSILLRDLNTFLKYDFHMVLDDLHLLESSPFSLDFIRFLLKTTSSKLRLVLVSRRPLDLEEIKAPEVRVLGSTDLALTRHEVAELFAEILQIPLSPNKVAEIHRLTEGWLMGLIMVGQSFHARDSVGEKSLLTPVKVSPEKMIDFFSSEVLAGFSNSSYRTLLKLSLLTEIPVPLAQELAEIENVKELLHSMEIKNFFSRRLNSTGMLFVFHHLFRETLRAQAEINLNAEERINILLSAGKWFKEQNDPEEALKYLIEGNDYRGAQDLLRMIGMKLIASNRLITLSSLLDKIPNDVIIRNGWLAYFKGVASIEKLPLIAINYFEKSRKLFIDGRDAYGELIASTHIIWCCIAISGNFDYGSTLLGRSEEIFYQLKSKIDDDCKIWITHILSAAFSFFDCNLIKTEQYHSISLSLLNELNLVNLKVSSGITYCYIYLFLGKINTFKCEIEKIYCLLSSPHVAEINKLIVYGAMANVLESSGNFIEFYEQKKLLGTAIQKDFVAKTIFGPWLEIWKADAALAAGHYDEAEHILFSARHVHYSESGAHLQSLFLQYIAYIQSLKGERIQAIESSKRSLILRNGAGGEYFKTFNSLLLGGAYAQMQMISEAHYHLHLVIERAGATGGDFFTIGAYCHLAFLNLSTGSKEKALEYLSFALDGLKRNNYVHFFGWTPTLMKTLLETAVTSGIQTNYSRYLAASRLDIAILENGTSIPILYIRTLGNLEFEIGSSIVLKTIDISRIQREFLGLLLSAPGLQMRQEEVQCALWPESSPEKARSNLDTLLSRLRGIIDKQLSGSVKNYITLYGGIIRLENCIIDHQGFSDHVKEGIDHFNKKEYWQAGLAFNAANRLWCGPFFLETENEIVRDFSNNLNQLFIESSIAWSVVLSESNKVKEGINILSLALSLDKTNYEIVHSLYKLYVISNDAVNAAKILKDYRRALEIDEYSQEEIDEILESLWRDSNNSENFG